MIRKTTRLATMAAALLIAAVAPHSPCRGSDFAAGLTDIGPDAYAALHDVFTKEAESWLDAAVILLPVKEAAKTDAAFWRQLVSDYASKQDTAIGSAKTYAKAYRGARWTGDWPSDWKDLIRKGQRFTLHMHEVGSASYRAWAEYAAWADGYKTDASNMGKKIAAITKDFKKLDELIGQFSVVVADAGPTRKLKEIRAAVEKMRTNTIPNELTVLENYRKDAQKVIDDSARKPETVRKAVEDFAKSLKEIAEQNQAAIPPAKSFADDLGRQAGELAAEYERQHKAMMDAVAPILGDHPPMLKDLTQFRDWKLSEFTTKLDEVCRTMDLEIVRREGIPRVD